MTRRTLAKVYKDVSVARRDGGHVVLLDGKPLRMPGRAIAILPTAALANVIAGEWRAQGERVDLVNMPLTGLAFVALDAIPRNRGQTIEHILGFGRSDLLCYRAEAPAELLLRQIRAWDPLVNWIAEAHGVRLQTGVGASYIDQPEGALLALEKLVSSLDDFQLAGLDRAAALTGSLVLALAILEGRIDAREAFDGAHVDELYQAEKWGSDVEAGARQAQLLVELMAVAVLMRLAVATQT